MLLNLNDINVRVRQKNQTRQTTKKQARNDLCVTGAKNLM